MKYLKKYKTFESDSLDPNRDKLDILSMEDYKNGDYHQSILNLGYFKWQMQDKDGKSWSYGQMVEHIGDNYHPEFKMMILLGKYNQQVGNGGHYQYYDNGYATGTGGVFSNKDNINLHEEMMELLESSRLFNMDESIKKGYEIMKEFQSIMSDYDERCHECGGQGYIEENCWTCGGRGDVEEEVDCPNCGGSGEDEEGEDCYECGGDGHVEGEEDCHDCEGSGHREEDCYECDGGYVSPPIDYLDDQWYKIDEKFMETCNRYAKRLIDAVIVKPRNLAKRANE